MANSIYLTTHDGLTGLVSARAASKALSAALREQGSSPDTVSFEQMKVILLGPVRQEFVSILPPAGLERSLKQLLSRLKELPPPEPEKLSVGLPKDETSKKADGISPKETLEERDARIFQTLAFVESPGPGTHTPAPLEAVQVKSASPAAVLIRELLEEETEESEAVAGDVVEIAAEAEAVEVEAIADEADEVETNEVEADETEATDPEPAEQTATPVAKVSVQSVQKISREALNEVVLAFAQLDNVKLVAAFTQTGKSVVSRGGGFDLDALSRLSGMALKLLGKSGALRSYYLAHSGGQLFLFPHGGYTLMVIGNAELNLGLVFTTLQKLKEER